MNTAFNQIKDSVLNDSIKTRMDKLQTKYPNGIIYIDSKEDYPDPTNYTLTIDDQGVAEWTFLIKSSSIEGKNTMDLLSLIAIVKKNRSPGDFRSFDYEPAVFKNTDIRLIAKQDIGVIMESKVPGVDPYNGPTKPIILVEAYTLLQLKSNTNAVKYDEESISDQPEITMFEGTERYELLVINKGPLGFYSYEWPDSTLEKIQEIISPVAKRKATYRSIRPDIRDRCLALKPYYGLQYDYRNPPHDIYKYLFYVYFVSFSGNKIKKEYPERNKRVKLSR